jgi:hypothetical protein
MTQTRIWIVVLVVAALLILVAVVGIGEGPPQSPLEGRAERAMAERDGRGVSAPFGWLGGAGLTAAILAFAAQEFRVWRSQGRELKGLLRMMRREVITDTRNAAELARPNTLIDPSKLSEEFSSLHEESGGEAPPLWNTKFWEENGVNLARLLPEDDFAALEDYYNALLVWNRRLIRMKDPEHKKSVKPEDFENHFRQIAAEGSRVEKVLKKYGVDS